MLVRDWYVRQIKFNSQEEEEPERTIRHIRLLAYFFAPLVNHDSNYPNMGMFVDFNLGSLDADLDKSLE